MIKLPTFVSFTAALIVLAYLSAGCASHAVSASIPEETIELQPDTASPTAPASSFSLVSTPAIISTFSSTEFLPADKPLQQPRSTHEPQPTHELTPTSELTPTPQQVSPAKTQIETPGSEFVLCSPITDVELSYLPKIISDPYRPPPPGSDARHEGVDFSYYNLEGRKMFIAGAGIQSVLPGTVAAAIIDSFPYGNFVIIETPGDWLPLSLQHRLAIPEGASLYLLYAHMQDTLEVALGDRVHSCQLIGKVGHSGNTVVDHLHLEARRGPAGAVFTELAAFQPTVTVEERANYLLWRTSGIFVHFDPMQILSFH